MTAPAGSGTLITPTAVLVAPHGIGEDEWHAARARGFGGSDVAAVLGMDRYRSPWHVWRAKHGEVDRADSEAADMGRKLEGFIADEFAERAGFTLADPVGTLAHHERRWMQANVDRMVIESTADQVAPLECKNRSERRAADWKDGVPDEPALQAHWYLGVTGYDHAWVSVLLGGNRLKYYRLERDQGLIDELISYCGRWWEEHVIGGAQPRADGSKATSELLARLWEVRPEATREVPASRTLQLLARRASLKDRLAATETQLAEVENELKIALGDAEVATAGGRTAYTWIANGTFRTKAFRAEQPELAATYVRLAPAVDTDRLAADHPDIYRRYRSRVLRVPAKGAFS